MTHAIALGPLLLPFALLLVFAAAGSTLAVGQWMSRRSGADAPEVEKAVWHCLLAAVLLARLAFVIEYAPLYLASPLTILDVRDGGWNAGAGLVGAWLMALHRWLRRPTLGRPLRRSLGAGTIVFVAGATALSLQPPSGQTLPPLRVASLDGGPVSLQDFKGQPTVMNLWATWCPPCVREMPVLQAAQEGRRDIRFVFLNQGEDAAHVARWLDAQGLALRHVLIDPQRQASAAFKQKGYPTTLFFNAKGELVSVRIGELSAATLSQKLSDIER